MNEEEIDMAIDAAKKKVQKFRQLAELEGEMARLERRLENKEVENSAAGIALCISECCCAFFDVPLSSLRAESRETQYVVARHSVFYLLKKHSDASSTTIGRMFGRDHGTVLNAWKSLAARIETDGRFAAQFKQLEELCRRALEAGSNGTPQIVEAA